MCLMESLVTLHQRCEDDTLSYLGHSLPNVLEIGENMLAPRRRWSNTSSGFFGENIAPMAGKLDQQGGLSLERIVLDHLPALFTNMIESKRGRTLGI
jgi:hypothetical protein